MEKRRQTVEILAEQTVLTIGRITNVFARRNVELVSLSMEESNKKGMWQYIISFMADEAKTTNLVKQLEKEQEVEIVIKKPASRTNGKSKIRLYCTRAAVK